MYTYDTDPKSRFVILETFLGKTSLIWTEINKKENFCNIVDFMTPEKKQKKKKQSKTFTTTKTHLTFHQLTMLLFIFSS